MCFVESHKAVLLEVFSTAGSRRTENVINDLADARSYAAIDAKTLDCAIGTVKARGELLSGEVEAAIRSSRVGRWSHRFMAGIYLFMGVICAWAAVTVRQQGTLVYLVAAGVFVAGCGRLLSMSKVGLPEPRALWLGYLAPELVLPWVLVVAHYHRPDR